VTSLTVVVVLVVVRSRGPPGPSPPSGDQASLSEWPPLLLTLNTINTVYKTKSLHKNASVKEKKTFDTIQYSTQVRYLFLSGSVLVLKDSNLFC